VEIIENLFGLHEENLQIYQMMVRAFTVFFTSLVMVRISGIRTLGKHSAFDNLTVLMLGAILGRAVVAADQPFFGSIIATFVIILLHRLVSWITFRNKKTGKFFKGAPLLLMKDGKKVQKNVRKTFITDEDISEALRHDINVASLDRINEVYLERSGEISFVKK
jgi:uncharacterized membrane protein YcaP (DUF421 family)